MTFAVWSAEPALKPQTGDPVQVYKVGSYWVITDDPSKANLTAVNALLASAVPADAAGFLADVKAMVGGAVALNTLAKQYPILLSSINNGIWADLQALIIDANTGAKITPTQYASIKGFVATRHIPITLP